MYAFLQSTEENARTQGVVVGCYDTKDGYRLTGCGEGLDGQCSGQLSQLIDRFVFLSCEVISSMCAVDIWWNKLDKHVHCKRSFTLKLSVT